MAIDLKYGKVTLEKGTIGEDEPVVVFRAQDALLLHLLDYYWLRCRVADCPDEHLKKIVAASYFVSAWQDNNKSKLPD